MKFLIAVTLAVVALSWMNGAAARVYQKRGLWDKVKTTVQKGIDGTQTVVQIGIDGTQTAIQKGLDGGQQVIDKILGEAEHDEGLLKNTWDDIRAKVVLSHYSPSNKNAATISFDAKKNKFSCATCNKNLPFVFFSHGFNSGPDARFIELHKDSNVILINWNNLAKAQLMYVPAAKNAIDVGRYVGKMFAALSDELGVSGSQIHLIGHSLGAHLVGNAARTFKEERNGEKISRVTALDPAGPSWMDGQRLSAIPECHANKLHKTDATFVDVIHTNAHMKPCILGCSTVAFGILHQLGHADFYVGNVKNGNVAWEQPGCKAAEVINHNIDITGCSHSKAIEYYANTISAGHKYPGWKCSSIDNCLNGVVSNDMNYMGEQAEKPATRSLYYVEIDM